MITEFATLDTRGFLWRAAGCFAVDRKPTDLRQKGEAVWSTVET